MNAGSETTVADESSKSWDGDSGRGFEGEISFATAARYSGACAVRTWAIKFDKVVVAGVESDVVLSWNDGMYAGV